MAMGFRTILHCSSFQTPKTQRAHYSSPLEECEGLNQCRFFLSPSLKTQISPNELPLRTTRYWDSESIGAVVGGTKFLWRWKYGTCLANNLPSVLPCSSHLGLLGLCKYLGHEIRKQQRKVRLLFFLLTLARNSSERPRANLTSLRNQSQDIDTLVP